MRLFIDCECNGTKGQLISMALVPEAMGKSFFYTEIHLPTEIDEWVLDYVVPRLTLENRETIEEAQTKLQAFLSHYDEVEVVADWPEDIQRFCELLITGPGTRIDTPPLFMRIVRLDSISPNPHNALSDAMALRDTFLKFEQHQNRQAMAMERNNPKRRGW